VAVLVEQPYDGTLERPTDRSRCGTQVVRRRDRCVGDLGTSRTCCRTTSPNFSVNRRATATGNADPLQATTCNADVSCCAISSGARSTIALQHHRYDDERGRLVCGKIGDRGCRVETTAYDESRAEQGADREMREAPRVEHRCGENSRLAGTQRDRRRATR